MSRSGWWRSRRARGLRRTARAGRWRGTSGRRAASAAVLRPDAASQLSDGVVVEARLTARLLGLRILRVDGTVLMSPARLEEMPRSTVVPGQQGRRTPALTTGASGGALAEAARLLKENGEHVQRLG